jgi:hypothetical protein
VSDARYGSSYPADYAWLASGDLPDVVFSVLTSLLPGFASEKYNRGREMDSMLRVAARSAGLTAIPV